MVINARKVHHTPQSEAIRIFTWWASGLGTLLFGAQLLGCRAVGSDQSVDCRPTVVSCSEDLPYKPYKS